MELKVVRSPMRRKTVSARLIGDTMQVNVPADISRVRLEAVIADFKRRFQRRELKKELNAKEDLRNITERLNQKYFAGKLKVNRIEYVTGQHRKFGCCNYGAKTIRISHRLARMPAWVRDYVVLHEMAHIIEPNHSKSFWEIVSRYKLAERAKGYLMALGFEADDETYSIAERCPVT